MTTALLASIAAVVTAVLAIRLIASKLAAAAPPIPTLLFASLVGLLILLNFSPGETSLSLIITIADVTLFVSCLAWILWPRP